MIGSMLSIFDASPGSPVSVIIGGDKVSDLAVNCFNCNHPRSDINVLPKDRCPKCDSQWVKLRVKF